MRSKRDVTNVWNTRIVVRLVVCCCCYYDYFGSSVLVDATSGYASTYYNVTPYWNNIPSNTSSGAFSGVPKGCTCAVNENPCTKYVCTCSCDVTAGACDPNCCCDTECSTEQINLFKDANACETDSTNDQTTATTKCIGENELYDINPKYRMNVENYFERSVLCIVVDNSPSEGSFFEDPGSLNVNQVFCDQNVAPTYAWSSSGTCTSSSQRYDAAFTTTAYAVDDKIPLASSTQSSVETILGGFFSLPTSGIDGVCNDQNPVGFMRSDASVCARRVVDATGSCTQEAYAVISNLTTLLLGVAPTSIGSFSTNAYVPLQISQLCYFDDATQTAVNCTTSPSSVPEPSDKSGGGGCDGVMRSMHITVMDNGVGVVTAAFADVVIYGSIASSTEAFATQIFSISFESNTTVTRSFDLGNLIERPTSGNAGYEDDLPVNAGYSEQEGANTSKSAIRMLTRGLHVAAPSATGGCDAESVVEVGFGQDVKSGCSIEYDEAALEAACSAFANAQTLPVTLSDWWSAVVNGSVAAAIGMFGNADPLDASDWIALTTESLSTYADVTMYNAKLRQCDDIVSSINLELLYAPVGENSDPQNKIVAARVWYGTDTWRFRRTDRSGFAQTFSFYTTVTFVEYDVSMIEDYVPSTPDLLPKLPHDLWYPFTLSSGRRRSEISVVLLATALAASVAAALYDGY